MTDLKRFEIAVKTEYIRKYADREKELINLAQENAFDTQFQLGRLREINNLLLQSLEELEDTLDG